MTAVFSGIFMVVIGGLAERMRRVRIARIGFYLSILGSLRVGLAPANLFSADRQGTTRMIRRLAY